MSNSNILINFKEHESKQRWIEKNEPKCVKNVRKDFGPRISNLKQIFSHIMPSIQLNDKHCYSVRFSPNNDSLIAVATSDAYGLIGGGNLFLLEITPEQTLKEILSFRYNNSLLDVEWCDSNPNPSIILTSAGDGSLQLWNVFAPKRSPDILSGHGNEVHSIRWNKISNLVLSASCDYSVRLWEPSRKALMQVFLDHRDIVYEAQFHPKYPNRFASVSGDNCLKFWDTLAPPTPYLTLQAHVTNACSCTWSQYEDHMIATGGGDGLIRGWDVRNYQAPIFQLGPIASPVKKIMFSPFSYGLLASISHDGKTRIWNCFDYFMPIDTLTNHTDLASGLDWNPSETTTQLGQLADCGFDSYVHIFNTRSVRT